MRLLRVAYWVGAVTDLLASVALLVPEVARLVYRLPHFDPGPDYRYAAGLAAALMLGWTGLLLWADSAPLTRRGVLLLTVFPVIVGFVLAERAAIAEGFVSAEAMLPTFVLQAALSAFFLVAYARAGHVANR